MMKTDRREFMAVMGTGAFALCAGRLLTSCGATVRSSSRGAGGDDLPAGLDERGRRILELAALAPSSHNVQPWRVRVLEPRRWRVGLDPGRQLPAVDPEGREMALSLGAFLENLVLGAGALGLEARVELLAGSPDAELVEVSLSPGTPTGYAIERIERRRTLRKGYSSAALSSAEIEGLREAAGASEWFAMGGEQGVWLREGAIESFRQQTWRDDAQRELAGWIRFGGAEVERHRDGLTPATMEIGGVAGWYVGHFMDTGDVMSRSFREQGIDGLVEQAGQGAGFLVITSAGAGLGELIDAGRRYERMMLLLRERRLAAHPMSQLLEELPWRDEIARRLGLPGVPQFVVRIGRLDGSSRPVSPRRPVSSFVG